MIKVVKNKQKNLINVKKYVKHKNFNKDIYKKIWIKKFLFTIVFLNYFMILLDVEKIRFCIFGGNDEEKRLYQLG